MGRNLKVQYPVLKDLILQAAKNASYNTINSKTLSEFRPKNYPAKDITTAFATAGRRQVMYYLMSVCIKTYSQSL